MNELTTKQKQWAQEMKLKALEMAFSTGPNGSHIGGGFSAMEIYAVLYSGILNVGTTVKENVNRDRIIASKGHGVLAQYTALWKTGLITDDELKTFDNNGTHFYGHPSRELSHGIEFSAGSLSLGLSFGVGVALSCKKRKLNNRVIVVLGDGECDEGLVWESLMSASNFGLNNLTIILDKNGYQLDGSTLEIMNSESLAKKFEAFGFQVDEVDGHNCEKMTVVIQKRYDKPNAIILNTVKAHGISFLENNKMSHMCALTQKQYDQALTELKGE
ncbi:MAG: transketolase [Bacteroidales bacterium]|nr:transketolase [Bacteroidales bacterium]